MNRCVVCRAKGPVLGGLPDGLLCRKCGRSLDRAHERAMLRDDYNLIVTTAKWAADRARALDDKSPTAMHEDEGSETLKEESRRPVEGKRPRRKTKRSDNSLEDWSEVIRAQGQQDRERRAEAKLKKAEHIRNRVKELVKLYQSAEDEFGEFLASLVYDSIKWSEAADGEIADAVWDQLGEILKTIERPELLDLRRQLMDLGLHVSPPILRK